MTVPELASAVLVQHGTIVTDHILRRLEAVEAQLLRESVERGRLLRTVEQLNARLQLAEGSLTWLRAGDPRTAARIG